METETDFIVLVSKITADGDCSHEIKRPLLLDRKAVINLGSILKNRDITLPTKVHLVKVMVFPVVMYGEGSGTPLQYSCLENPMDGGAWWAAVHGVAKSRTQLSDFTFTFHFHQETLQSFFTFCLKGGVIFIFEVIDISPSNLVSSLCFIQPGILHD